MANPDTPGKDTSEHSNLKSVQKYLRGGASILLAALTAMLDQGWLPPESAWVGVAGFIVIALGWITGEVVSTNKYTAARTAIKLQKVIGLSEIAKGIPDEDPTKAEA